MDNCPAQLMLDHIAILATMQSEIEALKKAVSNLDAIRDTLSKLANLNEQEMDFNRNQVISNKGFEATLIKINENLTKLNSRVDTLEETDEEARIAKQKALEKEQKDKDDRTLELVRQETEKRKSNLILIGVMFASILSFIGVIVSILSN